MPTLQTKLTTAIVRKIVERVARLVPLIDVASELNIDRGTITRWLKQGSDERRSRAAGIEPNTALDAHVLLSEQYEVADREAAVAAAKIVSFTPMKSGVPRVSAVAARKWLSRRFPELSPRQVQKRLAEAILAQFDKQIDEAGSLAEQVEAIVANKESGK